MWYACRESKIDKFDSLLCLVQEYVFKLNISVSYIALVAVVNGLDDLAPKELGLHLGHLAVRFHFEVAVQTATVDVLHDEEDLFVALKDFEELGDVLMVQLLHDLHLSLDRLASVGLHELCLLVDLDGNLLIEQAVQAKADYCVSTLADALADEIVIQIFNRAILCAEFIISRLTVF